MDNKEILIKAIERYGRDNQIDKAIEECAELIDALIKSRNGRRLDDEVIDEIADVSIMVEQLGIIFGQEYVAPRIALKLKRLESRLKKNVTPSQYS